MIAQATQRRWIQKQDKRLCFPFQGQRYKTGRAHLSVRWWWWPKNAGYITCRTQVFRTMHSITASALPCAQKSNHKRTEDRVQIYMKVMLGNEYWIYCDERYRRTRLSNGLQSRHHDGITQALCPLIWLCATMFILGSILKHPKRRISCMDLARKPRILELRRSLFRAWNYTTTRSYSGSYGCYQERCSPMPSPRMVPTIPSVENGVVFCSASKW